MLVSTCNKTQATTHGEWCEFGLPMQSHQATPLGNRHTANRHHAQPLVGFQHATRGRQQHMGSGGNHTGPTLHNRLKDGWLSPTKHIWFRPLCRAHRIAWHRALNFAHIWVITSDPNQPKRTPSVSQNIPQAYFLHCLAVSTKKIPKEEGRVGIKGQGGQTLNDKANTKARLLNTAIGV